MGSGVDKRQLPLSVCDVLLRSATITRSPAQSDKLKDGGCSYHDPGKPAGFAGAEAELAGGAARPPPEIRRYSRRWMPITTFVLIDCPLS